MSNKSKLTVNIEGPFNVEVGSGEQSVIAVLADGMKVKFNIMPRSIGIEIRGYGTKYRANDEVILLDFSKMEFGGDPTVLVWDNIRQFVQSNQIGLQWAREERRE